ncbi:MAG: hypothetical protein Q9219_004700 [cf. Caloplaca sp. 3 TL-2023]
MQLSIITIIALSTTIVALQSPHQKARDGIAKHQHSFQAVPQQINPLPHGGPPTEQPHAYLSSKTEPFVVNGSDFPEIDFGIGESYAGLLDNGPSGNSSLFFWFFPSSNPKASNEITVWLNGGPGCSSLGGLLFENGPFLWQPGTYSPVRNPYSWTNLTNMVWVDQPAGAGFSPGPPSVDDEIEVANQFNDFWKNFISTFGFHYRHVYLTGESYAGQYIPYIARDMLDRNDTMYYNLKGIQINDPAINEFEVLREAPAAPFMSYWANILNLNDTFTGDIYQRAETCGYNMLLEEALRFPPMGPIAPVSKTIDDYCDIWSDILAAAFHVNPCFNLYHITDSCPYQSDVLVFPSLNPGPVNYFNRSDVQAALHVPPTNYSVCDEYRLLRPDGSIPSGLGPLPSVIEALNNTIIGHGSLDYALLANGTLATIQNMTWNGAQGFQTAPSPTRNFFAPYHDGLAQLFDHTATKPFVQNAGAVTASNQIKEHCITIAIAIVGGLQAEAQVALPETRGSAYNHLRCEAGMDAPNAIVNCIPLLESIRREPPAPTAFFERTWQIEPDSCLVNAVRQPGGEPRIVVRDDIPDHLVYLMYRCFLERNVPSESGTINTGRDEAYALLLAPPIEPLSSSPQTAATIPNSSVDTVAAANTLSARAATRCRKNAGWPLSGAHTDCLANLLHILREPGSSTPRPWHEGDNRIWKDTLNCRVYLRFMGEADVFALRDVVKEAIWVMGKCFSGPERGSGNTEGYIDVGPRRTWTLRIVWGFAPRAGVGEGNGVLELPSGGTKNGTEEG